MPAGPPVELHAVPKGVPAVVPRATCVSPILQLRSESRAHERFVALEAKMLPPSDDADDVIGRREGDEVPEASSVRARQWPWTLYEHRNPHAGSG